MNGWKDSKQGGQVFNYACFGWPLTVMCVKSRLRSR